MGKPQSCKSSQKGSVTRRSELERTTELVSRNALGESPLQSHVWSHASIRSASATSLPASSCRGFGQTFPVDLPFNLTRDLAR